MKLPAKMWLRCAELVCVTSDCPDRWVQCPWLAWLAIDDKTWAQTFAEGRKPERPPANERQR